MLTVSYDRMAREGLVLVNNKVKKTYDEDNDP